MPKYTVRYEIEVNAATPKHAATVARDVMLDPDAYITVDVFPMESVKEADDWFYTEEHGWYAWFSGGSVHPNDCFGWTKACYPD